MTESLELSFTFDAEANGYLSDPFQVNGSAQVHIELESPAPVVTLKLDPDGEYGNYGQTPRLAECYNINLRSKEEITVRLATPVEVTNCYINN